MWWKSPRKNKKKKGKDSPKEEAIQFSETTSGIEISLSTETATSPQSIASGTFSTRVHRTQYNVKNWPILSEVTATRIREHRVPIHGSRETAHISYDEVLSLFKVFEPKDEKSHVKDEVQKLDEEIVALEDDRARLVGLTLSDDANEPLEWDINRLLRKPDVRSDQKKRLQERRGTVFTILLQSEKTRKDFCQTCHYRSELTKSAEKVIELNSQTCSTDGAASGIQQVALVSSSSMGASVMIAKDHGKAHHIGYLPERLFRRMKRANLSPRSHASNLLYLATGPMESYYAEFRNGEVWWAAEDNDFHLICQKWKIRRVAFGPVDFEEYDGNKHHSSSWIIIAQDGRVAWKNLPMRLHNLLENRVASDAAPEEVSLGPGSSYFIRFLDGSVNYSLPARVASQCLQLEDRGSAITHIAMSPELSHDFVIRSTETSEVE